MIKVVSPKYLGSRTSAKVKHAIVNLMFAWSKEIPKETKIAEAYQMLKKQGIVKVRKLGYTEFLLPLAELYIFLFFKAPPRYWGPLKKDLSVDPPPPYY